MKYVKLFFIYLSITGCFYQKPKETILKNTDCEKIIYTSSFKYGYNIEAFRYSKSDNKRYVLKLNSIGVIGAVFRHSLVNVQSVDNVAQYLVSDTTNKYILGPNLFESTIMGYLAEPIEYDSTKHIVEKISPKEIIFFKSIDSLMKQHNIEFAPLDSLEYLYWFNYVTNK